MANLSVTKIPINIHGDTTGSSMETAREWIVWIGAMADSQMLATFNFARAWPVTWHKITLNVVNCRLLVQWDSFAREMSELRDKIVPWFHLNYIFCLHKFCEFLKNKEIKNKIWNWIIQHFCLDSIPSIGVALHRKETLIIFTRVTANSGNCGEFCIIWYPLKAHNSSQDWQWLL